MGADGPIGHTRRTVTQPYQGGPPAGSGGADGAPQWPSTVGGPLPTSGMATAAIVFAGLSFFCLGPVGAIGGIICAFIGYREIEESEGRLGGKELCTVSFVLSIANLLLTVATIGAFVFSIGSAVSKAKTTTSPPVYTSPYVSPSPSPIPSPTARPRSSRGGESGQSTAMDVVSEVRIGAITLVDVPATNRPLGVELRAQHAKATAAKERIVLFVVTGACRPCMSVAAVLGDPKMQAALDHVRIIRVNAHDMPEDLHAMGAPTGTIPGFYLLSPSFKVVDGITGAEWDDDTADNVAPILRSFLRGTYTKRRRPHAAPERDDEPGDRPPGGVDL